MTKQNDGRWLGVRRKINANRNIAIARSIVHRQVADLRMKIWIDNKRIVRTCPREVSQHEANEDQGCASHHKQ
jgi:hypothetical protein